MASHIKSVHFAENRKLPPTTYHPIPIKAQDVAGALALLLTDFYGLYFKTKDIHKTLSEKSVFEYHPLLDSHGEEIFLGAGMLAECVQKLGGTLHRWPQIMIHLQKTVCVESADCPPHKLLVELLEQNKGIAVQMREAKWLCDEYGDSNSAILLRASIEETQRRVTTLALSQSQREAFTFPATRK